METGLTRRELGARVAILTALEKAVREAKDEARAEADRMLAEDYERDGISGVDLIVGDRKVGKLSMVKPGVGIYGGTAFAGWAYEHGMGRKVLTVDVSDAPQELLDRVTGMLGHEALPYEFDVRAFDRASNGLRVAGTHVVDAEGEIVPGTYVRAMRPRVSGCKPADVGEAMAAMDGGPTVAGLLIGGEE